MVEIKRMQFALVLYFFIVFVFSSIEAEGNKCISTIDDFERLGNKEKIMYFLEEYSYSTGSDDLRYLEMSEIIEEVGLDIVESIKEEVIKYHFVYEENQKPSELGRLADQKLMHLLILITSMDSTHHFDYELKSWFINAFEEKVIEYIHTSLRIDENCALIHRSLKILEGESPLSIPLSFSGNWWGPVLYEKYIIGYNLDKNKIKISDLYEFNGYDGLITYERCYSF